MAKEKKRLLYTDMITFNIYKRREDHLKKIINELIDISEKAIGNDKVESLKDLFNNPKDYLIEKYWSMYCKNRPQHLNKSNVFTNDTGINLSMLNELKKQYDKAVIDLKQFAPTVTAKSVNYKVKKDKFNKYLDKDKESHYNALKQFIDSAKKLKEFECYNKDVHLNRYSDYLQMKGIEVAINKTKFI